MKQESEKEAIGDQIEAAQELSERIDLVYAKDIDKVIKHLSKELIMDLGEFSDFLAKNYSLEESAFTISLAQFVQIYIEYIEHTHKTRIVTQTVDGAAAVETPIDGE